MLCIHLQKTKARILFKQNVIVSSAGFLSAVFPMDFFFCIFFCPNVCVLQKHVRTKRNANVFWFYLYCEEGRKNAWKLSLTLKFCVQGYNLFSVTLKINKGANYLTWFIYSLPFIKIFLHTQNSLSVPGTLLI